MVEIDNGETGIAGRDGEGKAQKKRLLLPKGQCPPLGCEVIYGSDDRLSHRQETMSFAVQAERSSGKI